MVETGGSGANSATIELNSGASEEIRRQIRRTQNKIDGRRPNTESGDGPALRIFNIYRKVHGRCPLAEITFVEIVGEMFEFVIVNYLAWLVSTPIPVNCTDDLKPRGHREGDVVKVVQSTTLSKYVGRIIRSIWQLFPGHPDFLPDFGQLVLLNQTADYCKVGLILVVHISWATRITH